MTVTRRDGLVVNVFWMLPQLKKLWKKTGVDTVSDTEMNSKKRVSTQQPACLTCWTSYTCMYSMHVYKITSAVMGICYVKFMQCLLHSVSVKLHVATFITFAVNYKPLLLLLLLLLLQYWPHFFSLWQKMYTIRFTLSLLMSYIYIYIYIYGAPCRATNINAVYIWSYVWQRWNSSLSICCTMFQHWINAESIPFS
jgi:hypothetical protein